MGTVLSGGQIVNSVLSRYKIVDECSEKKKLWVDERYDTYHENCKAWDFVDRTYRGGRDYKKAIHLYPFLMELSTIRKRQKPGKDGYERGGLGGPKTSFDIRVEQSWRINLTAALVDEIVGYLATKPPDREKLGKGEFAALKAYVDGVDRNRTRDLQQLSLETARYLLLRGITYVPTDMGMSGDDVDEWFRSRGLGAPKRDRKGFVILSPAEKQAMGLFPYSWHVHPSRIVQARWDRSKNPLEILLYEDVDSGATLEEQAKDKAAGVVRWYRRWTGQQWWVYRVVETKNRAGRTLKRELQQVASEANIVGAVPVTVKRYKDHDEDPFRGIAFTEDLAEVDRGHFNMWMALFWGMKEGAAQQTIVTTPSLPPATNKAKVQAAQAIYQESLTQEIAVLGGEDKVDQLEKNYTQGGVLLESIKALVSQQTMLLGFRDKSDLQALALSGVAFMRAFAVLNALLSKLGQQLSDAELSQLRIAYKFLGGDPTKITTDASRWPTNFDLRSVDDLLVALEKLSQIKAPPEVLKKLLKEFLAKFLADLDQDSLKELYDEVDAYDWSDTGAIAQFAKEARGGAGGEQGDGDKMPGKGKMPFGGGKGNKGDAGDTDTGVDEG